jgi:hypothetical protein
VRVDIVAIAIATVLTSAAVAFCLRAERLTPTIAGDVVLLQYAPWMRCCMWLAGLGFFALWCYTVVPACARATAKEVAPAAMATLLLPLFVGIVCEARVCLKLDGNGVRGRTAFRGYREVAWVDVVQVKFSAALGSWVLRDRRGEIVRVPRYLVGSEAVVTALETKVDERIWRDAVGAWRRLGGR